jgi:pimeloyl-ACP methyl ester carboxylesterase
LSGEQKRKFEKVAGKGVLDRLVKAAATTCGRDAAEAAGLTAERILGTQQPVVCLFGEQSPFLRLGSYLAENLANCRLVLIPDAEHFAFDENPAAFVQLADQELCRLAGIEARPASAAPAAMRRTETRMSPGKSD